ncbi:MFS transporter [Francisellaceae bacterium]|nr:MFS transporter [Francisellaceae bacterium]
MNAVNKIKIILVFVLLSIITSGIGVFILQSVNFYHTSTIEAGSLEGYQNFTAIIVSFFLFTILLKFGYRKSIVICSLVLSGYMFLIPFWDSIWAIKIFLILVGISMVLIKVCAYSSVSLVTNNEKEHASFINLMEAIYTLGTLVGLWLFSYFLNVDPASWMRVFWIFSGFALLVALAWWLTPFKDAEVDTTEHVPLKTQMKMFIPIIMTVSTIVFIFLLFSSEMLEQGVGSWLANFFHSEFKMTLSFSVKMASLLTMSMLAGRIFGAIVLRYVTWEKFFMIMFIAGFILMAFALTTLPHVTDTIESWGNVPWNAFAIGCIGFFLGPIYPTICSAMLSNNPEKFQAIIMSFIMVFTAFFDSVSSKFLGVLLDFTSNGTAFMVSVLPPFIIFMVLIIPFYKMIHKHKKEVDQNVEPSV